MTDEIVKVAREIVYRLPSETPYYLAVVTASPTGLRVHIAKESEFGNYYITRPPLEEEEAPVIGFLSTDIETDERSVDKVSGSLPSDIRTFISELAKKIPESDIWVRTIRYTLLPVNVTVKEQTKKYTIFDIAGRVSNEIKATAYHVYIGRILTVAPDEQRSHFKLVAKLMGYDWYAVRRTKRYVEYRVKFAGNVDSIVNTLRSIIAERTVEKTRVGGEARIEHPAASPVYERLREHATHVGCKPQDLVLFGMWLITNIPPATLRWALTVYMRNPEHVLREIAKHLEDIAKRRASVTDSVDDEYTQLTI